MLDLQKIIQEPEALASMLSKRGYQNNFNIKALEKLISEHKKIIGSIQNIQASRNTFSKEIGTLLKEGKTTEAEKKKKNVKENITKISELEKNKEERDKELNEILATLPNWIDEEVPEGGEEKSIVVKEWGKKPKFDFKPKTHYEIGEYTGNLDFTRGVKLAGSRFYIYRGELARLERKLLNFMLELHTQKFGYTEIFIPILVDHNAMFTTGQFPKFKGEYYTLENDALNLIPTAEVPLVGLYQNEIINEAELPISLTASSSCFRREAGAAGKDTRGLIRVHQFQKVELVQIVHPDTSEKLHQKMLGHAEAVLQALELPYRVLLKAAGDTGITAVKSYDIEVWMPGLDRWLEISSISNCNDYQARRGKIRFKGSQKGSKTQFVHTLNGSGVAAGRCMISIMENNQNKDLSFRLPSVLT